MNVIIQKIAFIQDKDIEISELELQDSAKMWDEDCEAHDIQDIINVLENRDTIDSELIDTLTKLKATGIDWVAIDKTCV